MATVKAPRKTEADWERHKEQIRLSMVGVSMKKLQEIMAEKFGFSATLNQYRTQFKHWGGEFNKERHIRKVKTADAEAQWRLIFHTMQGRQRNGKKSRVLKNGITLTDAEVTHEISRYRCNLTTAAQYMQSAPEPSIHSMLRIITPSPSPPAFPDVLSSDLNLSFSTQTTSYWVPYLTMSWPSTLPALQFEANILPKLAVMMGFTDYDQQKRILTPAGDVQFDSQSFHRTVDANTLQLDLANGEPPSILVQYLFKMMPQSSPGVHLRTDSLMKRGQLGLAWTFKLMIYAIANNYGSESGLEISDGGLLRLLQDSNISNAGLREFYRSRDLYIICLREALFSSAVRLGDVAVTSRLLQAGADPNQLIHIGSTALCSILEKIAIDNDWFWWVMPAFSVAMASGCYRLALCLQQGGAEVFLGKLSPYQLLICMCRLNGLVEPAIEFKKMCNLTIQLLKPTCDQLYEGLQLGMRHTSRPVVRSLLQEIRVRANNDYRLWRPASLLAAIMVQDAALVKDLSEAGFTLLNIEDSLHYSRPDNWFKKEAFNDFEGPLDSEEFAWTVTQLLEMGGDPDWMNAAYARAIGDSLPGVITTLLNYAPNSSLTYQRGEKDPLSIAIDMKQREIAMMLIDWGWETTTEHLAYAIKSRWKELAIQLIDQNGGLRHQDNHPTHSEAPYHCVYEPLTPLDAAVRWRQDWAIQLIQERYPTQYDCRALLRAVSMCWTVVGDPYQLVESILKRGLGKVRGCVYEGTALGIAAARADWKAVKLLNSYGINPQSTSKALVPKYGNIDAIQAFPKTPLCLAVGGGSEAVVQHMIDHGATLDHFSLEEAVRRDSVNLVDILVQKGTFAKMWDRHQILDGSIHYCLGCAAELGNIPMVRYLLKRGADPHVHSIDGPTAFEKAAMAGEIEVVEDFLAAGANLEEGPADELELGAALAHTAWEGHLGIVKRLIDLGARCNVVGKRHDDDEGYTALEAAACGGFMEIVSLLLAAGIPTEGQHARRYVRATKIATREGHTAIVSLLRDHRPWTKENETLFEEIDIDYW